jgi:hypothetical protein
MERNDLNITYTPFFPDVLRVCITQVERKASAVLWKSARDSITPHLDKSS